MIGTLRLKDDARCSRPAPAGFRLLGALDQVTRRLAIALEITSGDEPRGRAATDPHMTGEAYDVSVRDLSPAQIARVHTLLRTLLDQAQFTVLYECPQIPSDPLLRTIAVVNAHATAPHLHLQRKKGTAWPPADLRV